MKITYLKSFLVLISLFMVGCGNTKFLPKGDLLYIGGKVKVEDSTLNRKMKKQLQSELADLLRPKPNKKILGLRPKLFFYNLAGEPTKDKGFRYWLRNKVGEPPVLFSQVDLEHNEAVLRNYVENKGYFKSKTKSDSTRHGKRVKVGYTVALAKQYKIKEVFWPEDSTALSQSISKLKRRSLLVPGRPYDLETIKLERERIDARLKEKGYYFFNPDYILAQVDSTKGNYELSIRLKIKNETPSKAKQPYKINDIVVYPNYSIIGDSTVYKRKHAIQYDDFTIIDTTQTFNPRVFSRALYFKKGDFYNRKNHNLSLNRFVNLGTFKFVKNEFRVDDTIPNTLNAYYYLTLLPKKFIRLELGANTNSAGYTGTDLKINWSNRNFFGGAELFSLSLFGGADFQISGNNGGYNLYTFGGEASLIWPRLVAPFHWDGSSQFVPKTKVAVSYQLQSRAQLYTLNSFKSSFGYLWKENANTEHELKVLDVTFVSASKVTALYREEIAQNPFLAKVIEKQFIFGPTYSYTFTNTNSKRKKNTFYFNAELDLAGNITGLVTGANIKKGDTIKIFDVPFSQYAKIKTDLRYYLKLGKDSKLATRLILGAGYAYGNNTEMPYSKQFVIGGANSLRAFRAQSIGPGTFQAPPNASGFLPDETGDMKIEINAEYRAKLFSIVEGALFVDAGNVWLLNPKASKPGGEFSHDFLKQMAVGTGAGLRFDLSFLILRTDFAFPIRQPYSVNGSNWILKDVNFASRDWIKNNLIFNIAIGYPF